MKEEKLSWGRYFVQILDSIKSRSSCSRRHIGAIITTPSHEIITTGYNGTPSGVPDCDQGGCLRCSGDTPSGEGYEYCLCVHSEMNAIYSAAKQGKSVVDSTVYVSDMPCLSCVVGMVQCQIKQVIYVRDSVNVTSPANREDYGKLFTKILMYEYQPDRDRFLTSTFYHGIGFGIEL